MTRHRRLAIGYTGFYADRGQHPRRPVSAPGVPGSGAELSGGEAVARHMDLITGEVRASVQEKQELRKARLDPLRRAVEYRTPRGDAFERCAFEVGVAQVRVGERRSGKISVLQLRTGQRGVIEHGAGEVGRLEPGLVQ